MSRISVVAAESIEGVDPARVWAFVADPANVTRWAPVHEAGFMGTELPNAGHTLFLHRDRRARADRAWRCRIDEWEAGHQIRCSLETPGLAEEQSITIVVETRGTGAHAAAALSVGYRGDVPPLLALVYRWRIRAMAERAVRHVVAAVAS